MSTVLVTGAAGFIGQHVMKALTVAGHSPIGLDVRPVDGYGVEVDADIRQPLDSIPGLDAVIHLAAIAAPRECDKDPGRAFDVNVNGTLQVLKMALASGAKKVVFSSTAHVYGVGPKYLPSPETHPLSLGNTYTTTKILGEELCRLYWENHGLPYTTLRLFNAYGPGQRAGYFVPDMIAKAHGGSITLSDGSTTKDWVYIDDVARAFVLALGTPFVGAVNIGSGRQASLHEIAGYIATEMGAEFLESLQGGNSTHMLASTTRAKQILGWEPTVRVEEGLRATLADEVKAAV